MDKEIFKVYKDTRKGHRGALWEVSNYGNVRKNGKEYLPYSNDRNYLIFGNRIKLHQAVAELFIPNPENKPTVDHINRDRQDNRACNLRWATRKEQAENRDNDAISKAQIGNKYFFGRSHSEEARAKNRAAHLGNKNALGLVWVFNPTTEHSARVNPSQLTDYLDKGYIKGNKYTIGKVWVINPSTEHSALVNPSQLPEYLDKGYIRGRKIKK